MPSTKREAKEPVLRTKLHRPPLTADFVARERLINTLEKYPNRPLTLISAPAGYGKSTLAASWLEISDFPSAWISMHENDNDIRSFLTYVYHAIRGIFPKSMKELDDALAAPNLPAAEVLEMYIVNGLYDIEERFVLVLDDYQLIRESVIHDLLATLVSHNLPSLRIALLTRRDPPLPLHKLRGRGMITEISIKDLMFTKEETGEFLVKAVELAVVDSDARLLQEKLDGWVTGLRLISYAASDRESLDRIIEGFSGCYKTLADYLVEEVLARQPKDVSYLLYVTSILDRFSAPLCDHLSKAGDSHGEGLRTGNSFISWLQKNNIFIIPLDDEGYWFRYHNLFRQMLFNLLEENTSPDEIAELHLRAARWFADHDLIDESLRLAVEGHDVEFAIEIIDKNRESVMTADRWSTLSGWLKMIPENLKRDDPELMMTEAWVSFHNMDIQAVDSTLKVFERFLDRDDLPDRLKGEYKFLLGYIEYFMAEGIQSEADHKLALKLIPDSSSIARAEAELHLALSTQMVHGEEEAMSILDGFKTKKRKINNMHRSRLAAGEAFISLLALDLTQASRSANRMVKATERDYVNAWAYYLEAIPHYLWSDFDAAIELCKQVVKNRFALGMRVAADAYAMMANVFQCKGQIDKAKEAMISLIEFVEQADDLVCTIVSMSFRARLSLLQGDLESASRWLRTADLTSDGRLMLWWIEVPRITACRVLIAEGASSGIERAASMLEEYEQENTKVNNKFQPVIILPLLALARYRQERVDEAMRVLGKAIGIAEPASAVCPFIELGPEMAVLLRMLAEKEGESEFIRKLLDSFAQKEVESTVMRSKTSVVKIHAPNGDFLMETLTNRELVALRLLSQGLYYKEIADEMDVSKDTVKTHLRHVYQKLQTGSRREAVAMARELGIIGSD